MTAQRTLEVMIIGAGISGVGAGVALKRRGIEAFTLLEAAASLGGTWRDNRYPGVAVDIPSVAYCYPFATDFPWSRIFAPGAEILRYVQHCADRFDVSRHIRFGTRVRRAVFDEASDEWCAELSDGATLRARFLIVATGLFGAPIIPDIPGLDAFRGTVMHTGRWDEGHSLHGRRVAVIGTGASAVQVIPAIVDRVAQLTVFQRTPTWVSPRLDAALPHDSWWDPQRSALVRRSLRWATECVLEFLTFAIVEFQRVPIIVRSVERLVRRWMRSQVSDAGTRERLLPAYGLGCKRPTSSNDYLRSFDRAHVALVTAPITRITPTAILTADGASHPVETIVLATGFQTTAPGNNPSVDLVGRAGRRLTDFWAQQGRQAYAGVSVPGFPNCFLTMGPYEGGFNWFTMLDAQLAHIVGCLDLAARRGTTRIEVSPAAHERYAQHMRARAQRTVFTSPGCAGANSYYLDDRGEASLALPHTPWWRVRQRRRLLVEGYV